MRNILNNIFCHFEFVVCFAPLPHEVERNIILDLRSTADSVKSKRGSGGTPTLFVVHAGTDSIAVLEGGVNLAVVMHVMSLQEESVQESEAQGY